MMKAIILICAVATPRVDCGEKTARIVMVGPETANAITCAMQSQAYLAGSALRLGDGEYVKIVCIRETKQRARLDQD